MSLNTMKYSRSVEIKEDSEIVTVQYTIPPNLPLYTIPESPIAWARAVPTRTHGMWDSQKKLKLYLGLFIERAHGNLPLLEGPLLLDIKFCMPMTQQMLKEPRKWEGSWHSHRPDLDNLTKLILDTCNTILFEDDKSVSAVMATRVYSKSPRTEFRLMELK
jgi:Holliday junction resolvase RusA-like endonuclease